MFGKSNFGRGGLDNCMATQDYTKAFENDFTITPNSCIPDKSCQSGYRSFNVVNNNNPDIVTAACCTCNKNCIGDTCPVCKLYNKDKLEYGTDNCFASSSSSSQPNTAQFNQQGPHVNSSYTDCSKNLYSSENSYDTCMQFNQYSGIGSEPENGPLYSSSSSMEPDIPVGPVFQGAPQLPKLKNASIAVRKWWNPFTWWNFSSFGSSNTNIVLILVLIIAIVYFLYTKKVKLSQFGRRCKR
uniref:Uncharacterized protein n=1 Tax=viral metagenome TaxID=1070528 RepID=A0A6C0AZC5_9ZZZZ